MLLKDNLRIRPMTYDDLNLMVKWLNHPKVLEFYEEPPSDIERVTNKYGPRIEGKHYVTPCIVEYKNAPIGYMQYYKVQENDLMLYELPENQTIYGIDQFIGEPELWGKGIGTLMIRMMLDFLWNHKGANKIILDVKKSNKRAIASYKKCGFKQLKDINPDSVLMGWLEETT